MEYLPEFLDYDKLEQSLKSNVISEAYRAAKVMVEIGLPFNNITDDNYLVDFRLDNVPDSYKKSLLELQYLLKYVQINPITVDSLVYYIIEYRLNSGDFNKDDLDFLLALVHQIRLKHEMEFIDRIDEIFECLVEHNLFSNHSDWKHLIYHNLLPYFLNPYNESRLKKLLDLDKLDVVCALHEYFISSVVPISGLWPRIQNALREAHQRKNALFLLKRRLQLSDDVKDDDSLFESPSSTQYNNLIQLLEVSDAKQLHLLQPSMHLLLQLNELHLSWQITAWVVYLTHPRLSVVKATLSSLLDETWWLHDNDTFEQMIPLILRGVNMASGKIDLKYGSLFNQITEQQMTIMSKHGDNIAWIPTSFCYFHKELLRYMTLDSVSFLSVLNRLASVPDKNIRYIFMELYLIPKIFEYIMFDKNCGRAIKDVCYAVFLHYHNGDTSPWKNFIMVFRNSLSERYNLNSVYQVNTVTNNYLQFLISLKLDRKNSEEFTTLSQKYVLQTFNEEIVDEFGVETLYEVLIDSNPSFENRNELSASLEITLLDDSISFTIRSVALQLYSALFNCKSYNNVHILDLWTKMLLSGDYKFDKHTCKAFIQLHRHLTDEADICNTILSTQTDSVIVTLFEYLAGDIHISILELCFNKLMDMKMSSSFEKACNVLFVKLSPRCFTVLVEIKSFHVLFKESLHLRYLVTKQWINMSNMEISTDLRILNLVFEDCLIAKSVRFMKERMNFKFMKDLLNCHYIINRDDESDTYSSLSEYVDYANLNKFFLLWHCYKSQVVVLNAMIICFKFEASCVLDICKAHLDKVFQKRYYTDSQIHIEKTRIYQLLLMVYQRDSKLTHDADRFPIIFKYLCEESNQNDVKQFQMLLLTDLEFYPKLLDFLQNNSMMKVPGNNALSSVIIILCHIAQNQNKQKYCSDVLIALVPYTMGANFKLRLVSQMSILHLLQYAEKKHWTDLVEKYKVLQNALELMLTEINWNMDLQYLAYFNPNEYYTAESILVDIPRLNNVCEQEWDLNSKVFEKMRKLTFCNLKFYNNDRKYSNLNKVEVKEDKIFALEMKSALSDVQASNVVQRKPQSANVASYDGGRSAQTNSGLIVIGSLVDSAANLGGLARTCHILGAATMIIHDIHSTKDADFKSLSMSAERWLHIQEVKVDKIGDYLKEMRKEGYAIIGAEQTNQSVILSEHPFQYKTVLLLGNERTGIPADILTMLDTCVEIPQYGVVRSLNVHVAAALIIYEYSQKIKTANVK